MKWNNKGHEFDDIAETILGNKKKIVIWGAGTFGYTFCSEFKHILDIEFFVDSNVDKVGMKICGYAVENKDILRAKSNTRIVLVSTGYTKSVYDELDRLGYKRWINYFHIDEFATLYYMYKYKILYSNFLSIPLTDFCTLRCEKCSAFNPYIKEKRNYDYKNIQHKLDIYFRWVDKLDVLALSGGDSFLNPDIKYILERIACDYYKTRINHIEIYSNAIIIPSEDILSVMKEYEMIYRFTDYGEAVSGQQKIDKVLNALERFGIKHDRAKFDRWGDCGYPQESNGICEEVLEEYFNKCDRRSCMTVYDDRLFFCGMAVAADMADYCKYDEQDGFILTENVNKRELMEFILGYSDRGYLEYCKKCNGGPNINTHYTVPGKQIIG